MGARKPASEQAPKKSGEEKVVETAQQIWSKNGKGHRLGIKQSLS